MAYFCVAYDLVKDKDYTAIIDRLKELNAVKTQLSFWLVDLNNTASEVTDDLASYMDDDDKLMVIEFSEVPGWTKGIAGTKAWIDARF
jgi:CRISPR associated protein Cas2 family